MNNNYNSDRQWSDEIYHGSTKKPILDLVTKSRLFGKVEDYVPSSEEDDNINCIDTWFESNIRCAICRSDLRDNEVSQV